MSLSKLSHLPSFSLVLTSQDEHGAPVEILALKDSRIAIRREVHLNFQPKDSDPLMKTIDSRFAGSLAYDVKYSTNNSKTDTTHVYTCEAGASTSGSSSSTDGSPDDDDDGFSSTSTTEVDLGSEFGHDMDSETATVSDDAESILGRGGFWLGLHHQPASVVAQVFPPPPCYDVEMGSAIPMRVFNAHGREVSSEPSSPSRRRHVRGSSPSGRLTSWKLLFKILKAFQYLWRRLRKVGDLVLHECTKDL